VVRYDIKEISAAPFVASEVAESNRCHKQSSDLCHYVAKSEVACEVKEAFLGFDDVSNDRRAAAIFFSCPSCFYLFMLMLAYFTWRTASTISSVCEENWLVLLRTSARR